LKVRVPAGFVGSYDFGITLFDGAGSVLNERIIYLHAKSPIAAGPGKQAADITPPEQTASIPPATDAPAAAEKASPTPDQLAQAERLLRQGKSFLDQGNITIARQYFARAADLGLPMAALRMAEAHDPHELERANVHGPRPNISVARQWYQRAAQLGIPEAEARLRRLGGQ
jgi:TPR repeat protein